MQTQPLVSIGMPVYNGVKYLKRALDSLLAQDYQNFELIISDNASTDQTEATCLEYAAKDSRIRYYRSPANSGMGANFQRVLQLARGEYFMWAAHDDYSSENYVSALLDRLIENPALGLCAPKIVKVNQEDSDLSTHPFPDVPDESFLAKRTRIMMEAAEGAWVYGLYRIRDLRNVYPAAASDGIIWGGDYLVILGLLYDQKIGGTNEAIIYQRKTGLSASLYKPKSALSQIFFALQYIFCVLKILISSSLPFVAKLSVLLALPGFLDRKVFHFKGSSVFSPLRSANARLRRAIRRLRISV